MPVHVSPELTGKMPGMDDATAGLTGELSRRQASDAVSGLGWRVRPRGPADTGAGGIAGPRTSADAGPGRSVQLTEIVIDALDIAAVRPFWKAVIGYGDEADRAGPRDPLIDPMRQGPACW